jgi:alpha-glucosidase (family GH31 glycosyl hydrolase)
VNGVTQMYHRTGDLNWYIFTGANGDAIMKSYYHVIGAPKYVPAWATGVLVWRDQDWNGKEDILNDARQMTALKIPITSIMVDRPYSDGNDGWSKMNFGKLFSDPGAWIHELNADYNLRFLSWVAPCTFGDTSIVKAMPGGHHGYIDLTDPASVAEFTNALTKNIYEYGVQGHKMDRGEEIFPVEDASRGPAEQIHLCVGKSNRLRPDGEVGERQFQFLTLGHAWKSEIRVRTVGWRQPGKLGRTRMQCCQRIEVRVHWIS